MRPRPGAQALIRLCLQGETVQLRLGHVHPFHVRAYYNAEEGPTHDLELGLLLFVRPEIQITRVDLELRMAVIPSKLHDTVPVDLLVNSNLLAVTNLTVAQALRRFVHAALGRVDLADDEDTDLVRPD